jgi:tRNA (mo5U34)-methyltransferase
VSPAAPPLSRADLQRGVDEFRWFHTIDLGRGVVTPGENRTASTLKRIRLPDDLTGKSVLDIGAWDGFFSFEAERRGASRVVAVDPECWREPAWGERGFGTRRPFDFARRALDSTVEPLDVDLLDLSPETVGRFDVVLFLGVFYHLPDPWPYVRAAAGVCDDLLIVETHADLLDVPRPAMALYPGAELENDESNWWGPNAAALAAMIGETGFGHVKVYSESRLYRALRAARRPDFKVQQGRIVAHARRT